MAVNRSVPREVAQADERLRRELATPFRAFGPVLEVLCAGAGDPVAIAHGVGGVPDGLLVLMAIGGQVQATSVTGWTDQLAYLVADTDNTRVRVVFVAVEEVRNA
jgi:hypothetical protein